MQTTWPSGRTGQGCESTSRPARTTTGYALTAGSGAVPGQIARLAGAPQGSSPVRTEAIRRQIREGRHVFQAQMLARGAIPLDGTASPQVLADSLLARLGPGV